MELNYYPSPGYLKVYRITTEGILPSLHLGCGPRAKIGDVGVDIIPGPAVDIVHDLDAFPWPLPSDTYDRILCKDVLEHLRNIPKVMEEIHRVAINHARVLIQVPTGSSRDLFTDPTHIRGFSYESFGYFDPASRLHNYSYSGASFTVRSFRFFGYGYRHLKRVDGYVARFANRRPELYESRLSYIWPLRGLRFVLEVIK